MSVIDSLLKTVDDSSSKIIPHIVSLDEIYLRVKDPLLLNSIKTDQDYIQKVTKAICDTSNNNNVIASCECEHITSEYRVESFCPICNTEVMPSIVKNISNKIWLEIPNRIKYVMHPRIYSILSFWLKSKSDDSYLNDILDVTRELPEDFNNYITGQGFNYFYENFDYIINFFSNIFPKTKNRANNKIIGIFIEKHRDVLWCRKLPILSKYLQSITMDGYSLRYADKALKYLLKPINQFLIRHLTDLFNSSDIRIEKSMWNIYYNYNKYYENIIVNRLNPKRGYFRKNVFGTRLHFTSRAVAIPIVAPSFGDEIYLSWKAALNLYKFHIINILTNRFKIKVYEAYDKFMKAFYSYDPIIDQIFQLLILECKFKGLPYIINRNPSLLLSNLLLTFVVKVKPSFTKISKKFIQQYGRGIDVSKISSDISYSDNIYQNRMIVVDENRFDSKEFVKYYISDEYSFEDIDNEKFNISQEQINEANDLILDYTISASYLICGLMNLDFDGDSLNGLSLQEMSIVERMIDRMHPANYFFDNDDMEISSKISIPIQHLAMLNSWLQDE